MTIAVETLSGPAITAAIPALARLRIAVFAEWPYLYDGDAAYEAEYLHSFAASPRAALIVARAGQVIIGAATASPMADQEPDLVAEIAANGLDPAALFYFGESVLLPEYRGRGLGHAFFDHREAAARAHGFAQTCFASVIRPDHHPARPAGHRPLDPFWRARGYAPLPGCIVTMHWKDHDEPAESPKPLQVWHRTS